MRKNDRRPNQLTDCSVLFCAPSSLVPVAAILSATVSLTCAAPAHAGWGRKLMHAVIPGLGRRHDSAAAQDSGAMTGPQPAVGQSLERQTMPPRAPAVVMVPTARTARTATMISASGAVRASTPVSAPVAAPQFLPRSSSANLLAARAVSPVVAPSALQTVSLTSASAGVNRSSDMTARATLAQARPPQVAPAPGPGAVTYGASSGRTNLPPGDLLASAPVAMDPLTYHWSPRPALDYLAVDGDVESALTGVTPPKINTALPPRPDPVVVKPRLPVPPSAISRSFERGTAGDYTWDDLVAAGVFENDPLRGSIYKRQGRVKYIILHSTETASPADARRVILSWNNRGLKHPGAQFVVDRDGTICSTTNPDLVVVHIEPSRALSGYSNDNSIGIEIVRSGKQEYTRVQLDSVNRLVAYLQSHYAVPDANVTTHQHVQPSDRSDPVNFNMVAFESEKSALQAAAVAFRGKDQNRSEPLQYVSTMPKAAPEFKRRNRELVLRD
ncbi:MAG: N-acetylmuramoyl-L-alanine amidase [Cyanobacteria bacterium SZAS LIN-5]|nr:N-acetylmuramoyl-L-alanine amidase [Cyanobacteria bacterium SZAS LIN-5]RTL41863.1 MAG: N-acetylmuramoyl-L-alanine amidase [Candidatus Melainabacteria bacterium]